MKIGGIIASNTARKAYQTKVLISAVSIVLASVMLIFFVIYATGTLSNEKGMFEISSTSRGEGSISLSSRADFSEPTVFLQCEAVEEITNISESRHIPADVDTAGDGSHNGRNYFAYTFYLRNAGDVNTDVEETVRIISTFKGAEKAIRLKVYRDGVPTTYAAPAKSGMAEYGTVPFLDKDTAYSNRLTDLSPGDTVKYTVVIWLEGDDPECLDDIKGGFVRFAMDFNVINGSDKQAV